MSVGAEEVVWKSKRLLCIKCVINMAAVSVGNVRCDSFRLMTAMTDGLGLFVEITIRYEHPNNYCKSCY